MIDALRTGLDLLIVIFGFGLIIFVHELGHFLAARWAGIRVMAFAIGFGPAIFSYRKGVGVRRGSGENEYFASLRRAGEDGLPGVSPTEYRLNALPLGGYVKMLGQEDLDPQATSSASDSYQNCPPWKRMIVISAGVVMNLISAAALFIFVFMVGLASEPASVGGVDPAGPAATAVALNAEEREITEVGLKTGDRVVRIDGKAPRTFNDIVLAVVMAQRGQTLRLGIERPGVEGVIEFEIEPEIESATNLQQIGVSPMRSATLMEPRSASGREAVAQLLGRIGLEGVEPGMTLIGAEPGGEIDTIHDLVRKVREGDGSPVTMHFARDPGARTPDVSATMQPLPAFDSAFAELRGGTLVGVRHLLGLTPVLRIDRGSEPGARTGLEGGDIFARLGAVEYPNIASGIGEIRAHAGGPIDAVVLRGEELIELSPRVTRAGQIGFGADDTAETHALLSVPPAPGALRENGADSLRHAADLPVLPGSRLTSVGGRPVGNFTEIRAALLDATRDAYTQNEGATVELLIAPPSLEPNGPEPEPVSWTLSAEAVEHLHTLGWNSPVGSGLFEPVSFLLKADNPIEAIALGIGETHRVMLTTYVTFLRLFQGTVKVEHLKGPVGIAHLGTRIAERGIIWLLFFAALISVNLAVINFLPLPIVDGGQFLMILYEQITGRPVPIPVQNIVTLIGLVLIGALFIIVTYNDIVGLFGGL